MDMVCKRRDLGRRKRKKDKNTDNPPPNSVVISIFAIIILSTIGSMFAAGNHTVMGSSEDPKDGKSVAAAVFGAVIIYGVRIIEDYKLS